MNDPAPRMEQADLVGLPDYSYWPADHALDIPDLTLGGLLRDAAREVPDRLALVEGIADPAARRRWTYREHLDISERLARALLGRFARGDRIIVYGTNSPEWVFLQHAMSLAGLILVPVNPAYTAGELGYIIANSNAAGLFYDDSFRDRELFPTVEEAIHASDCAKLHSVDRVQAIWGLIEQADPAIELPEILPGDTLQIQYTSGTTGKPKGALLHHKGVLNTSRSIARRSCFPMGGVHINAMPMFHIAGAAMAEFSCLAYQGTFVLMPHWDAGLMLELFESERGNATLIVPTMILGILNHPDLPRRDVSSWQTIFSGAANVPAAMVRQVHRDIGCKVCIIFGQTESNGPITLTSPDDRIEDQTDSVGQPLPQVEVQVVDPHTLEVQPVDTVGEIWVRGFQTMTGYFEMPEKTKETLLPDGWLRTGDLGSMDARGFVKITGRLKEMIIRGGMNLYPKEIEDVLFVHPDIDQVAVLGLPNEKWGEIVAAVLSTRDGAKPTIVELEAYCRRKLASQKVPSVWLFIDHWPLTPSGKIQKHVLADMIAEGRLRPVIE
ncbi:AMP-binding protein [Tsuneonella sp. CC-YZS046]|uniref:class I adenylate-forming enzyme family protein n=1 Tax=Tsuneonella sp. CC-YZS046 TaxID=3042152 RepID=UPI002D79E5B5|nr:AMP-binding protein [Tsuneonella sp. CC-YZS046]WRO65322.1 AMP-binding protein [Tsuneonella sp. CC-YZS046]